MELVSVKLRFVFFGYNKGVFECQGSACVHDQCISVMNPLPGSRTLGLLMNTGEIIECFKMLNQPETR